MDIGPSPRTFAVRRHSPPLKNLPEVPARAEARIRRWRRRPRPRSLPAAAAAAAAAAFCLALSAPSSRYPPRARAAPDGGGSVPVGCERAAGDGDTCDAGHVGGGGPECRMYMAESSIPGAGWGVYTSVPLRRGDYVPQSAASDVILLIVDVDLHDKLRGERRGEVLRHGGGSGAASLDRDALIELRSEAGGMGEWMPVHYFWEAHSVGAGHHANHSMAMVSGVGALVNCHPGLINAEIRPPDGGGGTEGWRLSRHRDPGAGAIATYWDARFRAKADVPAGMELFVNYGMRWFEDRMKELGPVPLQHDWSRADSLLLGVARFFRELERRTDWGNVSSGGDALEDLWRVVRKGAVQSERIQNALPLTWEEAGTVAGDIKAPGEGVTARHMTPGAVRSREWLEKNGRCADNVQPGLSTIPQAGRGAFAVRSFREGEIMVTSPVLHIQRGRLQLYRKAPDGKVLHVGEQLIVNYCYGHPNSTLLLFPYASGINLINHGGTAGSNAAVRWPTDLPLHRSDWLNRSVESLLVEETAGLTVEVVATRDIAKGGEILMDYGREWEQAWEEHVQGWKPLAGPGDLSYIPVADLRAQESVIRTMEEQKVRPYPPNAMTVCRVWDRIFRMRSTAMHGRYDAFPWPKVSKGHWGGLLPCDILSRRAAPSGKDLYTILGHKPKKADSGAEGEGIPPRRREAVVTDVPREAIEIVDRPYSDDEFLRGAFRHEIGVLKGMFPESWMDLT